LSRGLCVSSKEIEVYVNYILKYLQIPIHVVEMGNYFRIDVNRINSKAKCFLNKTDDIGMHIKKKINTPFFVYVDANILLPIENIIATVDLLLTNDRAFVFPMNIIFDMNPFEYNLFMDTLHLELKKANTSILQNNKVDYIESFAVSKKSFIASGGNNLEWHFFYENGFNLEKQARFRFLGFDIKKVNKPAFKLFSVDDLTEMKIKNSQEKYLELCVGTLEDLKRKIASKRYSFRKNFGKKSAIEDISIGISSLKSTVNIRSLKEKLISTSDITIQEIGVKLSTSIHKNFIKSVQSSKAQKFDFLIILYEDIFIHNEENISAFWSAVEKMQVYGLQILTSVNDGGFKDEIKLSNDLFWIDDLPNSTMTVIHKSLYDKILTHVFVKDKSIEQNLNLMTSCIGTVVPNLGLPKPLYPNDENYMVSYEDRIKHIKRFEDKLKWISINS
jgi:hypothetical protein